MSHAIRLLCLASVLAATPAVAQPTVHEYRNGRWFDGRGFVEGSRYARFGVFVAEPSAPADTVIDLEGRWIVPPFAEAHNHNVEAGSRLDALLRRYLSDGVFYVKNPDVLPSSVEPVRDRVNGAAQLEVAFAFGGFTGPGGHPIGVVQRNVDRGLWTEADGDGAFYYAVSDESELRRAWPALLAHQPDFVKAYLLYSEEYEKRARDASFVGHRGLDPDLLPVLVDLAHQENLRVTVHVETAADFRAALEAGADEIAHLPGFRGDEENRFPRPEIFLLDSADARRARVAGTVVVTTLADFEGAAPDSLVRQARAVFRHNLGVLHEQGVDIAIGSDGYGGTGVAEAEQVHALGVLDDLALLKAWVETTPKTIFPHRRIGRLRPGYEASFLVLGANPLDDFSAIRDIRLRVKRGGILEPEGEDRPATVDDAAVGDGDPPGTR